VGSSAAGVLAAARSAAITTLAVTALSGLGAPAAAAAGWGRPFRLAQPQTTDLTPARIAFSATGEAAVAFGTQAEDNPALSSAFVASRSPQGRLGAPRAVPAAKQVLDLAFDGAALELLTGTASAANTCCDSVGAVELKGGRFARTRTLVSKLTGATLGLLSGSPPAPLLAAVATDRGVWVAQSSSGDRFAATRRLTAAAAMPLTLAASSLPSGQTTVAWTASDAGENAPTRIFTASTSALGAPRGSHLAFTVGAGHQIDELGLAAASARATAGWIESWFDRGGAYHAQVVVADLGTGTRARAFAVPGQLASGLTIAGDASGDQVVAWKACDATPSCSVRAALRRAGQRFGAPVRLGAIDADQDPAAAISSSGSALVGWIDNGHVLAAARSPRARAFAAARLVSGTSYAADLALAFGPTGQALAAWTQGTFAPDLVGAAYSSP
jgi:hypothetical protein